MKIGVTGGIGSGKSYVCHLIEKQLGIEVYDCDTAAKRLMRTSMLLRQQLIALIGPDTYINSPECLNPEAPALLNKPVVAKFLLASPENAKAIDDIVHPAVFRDYEASGQDWVESAILYESGLDKLVDCVVVVTAPEPVRIERIMARDHITADKAQQWIARQLPQDEVRQRADYEIVNDGLQPLEPQIEHLFDSLNQRQQTINF